MPSETLRFRPFATMVFPSIEFAVFFPPVLALNWLLMSRPRLHKPFILFCSYVFYAAANPKFCLLLGGVTLGNQAAATLIDRSDSARRRKAIVTAAVVLNLLTLGVFKYYGFFAQDVNDLLDSFGLGLPIPLVTIALPIGLSFFVFQAISYTVDVYRGLCERAKTIDVALYLSFFPHLVAGPIVRAREFLPQLASPRDPAQVAIGTGVFLVGLGLVKKVVIADFLARHVVDPTFAVPEAYGAPDMWLAIYCYAAQIYCDFSGYTDIAIGLALLTGYVFPRNFHSPYRASSFRDFWRRWHMTLSRYLRDFLYIPLGGNRKGKWGTARNLMITMLLGGLWHGAAWGFVLWGGLHGLYLGAERILRDRVKAPPTWVGWLIVLNLVVLAWIPFRAPDLNIAGAFLGRLVHPGALTLLNPGVVIALLLVFGLQLIPERPIEALRMRFENLSPAALGLGLATCIAVVGATVPGQAVPPFIYFQF
ncbi:MAG: alginate O-acetyltransferase complex protein AlgI [Solirubrobacteraceae bacterium]|nr:alginate O-acetyltransferase complex protein AlgI [Solirubrobacteraceae bacterium]